MEYPRTFKEEFDSLEISVVGQDSGVVVNLSSNKLALGAFLALLHAAAAQRENVSKGTPLTAHPTNPPCPSLHWQNLATTPCHLNSRQPLEAQPLVLVPRQLARCCCSPAVARPFD